MTNDQPVDYVITFKPDATPEEEERFLTELAYAIFAIARHAVAMEEEQGAEDREELKTIDF